MQQLKNTPLTPVIAANGAGTIYIQAILLEIAPVFELHTKVYGDNNAASLLDATVEEFSDIEAAEAQWVETLESLDVQTSEYSYIRHGRPSSERLPVQPLSASALEAIARQEQEAFLDEVCYGCHPYGGAAIYGCGLVDHEGEDRRADAAHALAFTDINLLARVLRVAQEGRKIAAIKDLRSDTNLSLMAAKHVVEGLRLVKAEMTMPGARANVASVTVQVETVVLAETKRRDARRSADNVLADYGIINYGITIVDGVAK
jgi:hypothetical protein